jgi:hypothetical protein
MCNKIARTFPNAIKIPISFAHHFLSFFLLFPWSLEIMLTYSKGRTYFFQKFYIESTFALDKYSSVITTNLSSNVLVNPFNNHCGDS